jgi:hypothetical protein
MKKKNRRLTGLLFRFDKERVFLNQNRAKKEINLQFDKLKQGLVSLAGITELYIVKAFLKA